MQITCWAYEQAANSEAHVWVAGDETKPLDEYWRSVFRKDIEDAMQAAEKRTGYE